MEKLDIPKTLKELSDIFKMQQSPLYIVGGYVRNALLGFCETDIDICGPMHYQKVKDLLKNSVFSVKVINEKLGTIHIKSKISEEEFEYSTFRKEDYNLGGEHTPNKIEFVSDIKQDAIRRDFTCNSIYYDIQNEKIIDFFDGVKDVLEHRIKTVDAPTSTFDNDGLRILRMVRFSCELDFEIDDDTFCVAKEKISQLKDISQERFNKEVVSILFSDYKYDSIKNPHCPTKGIKLLSELGAFQYIFREVALYKGLSYVDKCLKEQWVTKLGQAPSLFRLSCFVYEILMALKLDITKNNIEMILGSGGLMVSKDEIKSQVSILTAIQVMPKLKNEEVPLFVQQNFQNINKILDFARIFGLGDNVRSVYKIMQEDNVPLTIKDLKINGYDLIKNFPQIERNDYSSIFEELLKNCAYFPEMNTKPKLLSYIRSKFLWLKQFYWLPL